MSSSSLLTPRELVTSLISSLQQPHQTTIDIQPSNNIRNAPQHIQKALLTLHILFPNETLSALDVLDRNLITRLKVKRNDEAQRRQEATNAGHPTQRPPLQDGYDPQQQLRHLPKLQDPRQALLEDEDSMATPFQTAPRAESAQRQDVVHIPSLQRQSEALGHERSETRLSNDASHTRDAEVYVVRSGQLPSRLRQLNHTTSYEVRLDAWSCSCPAFAFSAFPATAAELGLTGDDIHQHIHRPTNVNWKFGGLTLGADMPVCKHLLACVLVEHSNIFASFVEEREVSVEELSGWAAGWGD